ncbi:hypothetical protein PAMA_006625 [Pampus argenteus]
MSSLMTGAMSSGGLSLQGDGPPSPPCGSPHLVLCVQDAGTYFPSVKRDPGQYLQPCSDSVKTWLRSMKNAGKVLLLITSSHSDYCRLICEHILGKDFEELFDVIITNALKPGFFSLVPQQRPFRTLGTDRAASANPEFPRQPAALVIHVHVRPPLPLGSMPPLFRSHVEKALVEFTVNLHL